MSDFKFWGWDKKPRTMLRFVKTGDIFCFQLDDDKYGFGRIMSLMTVGHISEFFDLFSKKPVITEEEINRAKRIIDPIIIDTYSLFDKKIESGSDWRIIGHQRGYSPKNVDGIYFAFGVGHDCKKKDFYGNVSHISQDEWENTPKLSPKGDYDIKKLLVDF
ncbi:TPA: immunity 26/phosphotriesterase HocA family protein [Citrobacter farmeri]|uniref:immunity 26/phosphotriesterase HocA family protein n=1 Tax=Citrobacter farmeri TaxID=67824 RepID=UPI001A26E3A1|nr:immunity 26/phosphotriesterase HocA family protein [Citrobacter farmeri]MBU5648610.1 immunity 26/phosphotriesterase HocA family protein [Pluralibacter sp. S54_ASV_43]HAT3757987.1 phosphotriesterase [Citrobacter amalonaticus]QZE45848.1 immunity 26/phosphotriesterase HocA family protein [Citrobacter farmeri]HCB1599109.1 immunity 26/phosphotriesterase HocA family protein [Citrobacter farmeri]HCB1657405.1 immunity 26/phosphotriesterase HocA family protein [Citrobacter farmeri]